MGKRRKARLVALQVLYSLDVNPCVPLEALVEYDGYQKIPEDVKDFARSLVLGTREQLEEIDRIIQEASLRWGLGRMAVVDRNLLRLATYEMIACKDTPTRVILNEAIELAKSFGGEESGTFINGVLDRIGSNLGRDR